ncbi:MAG: 4-hydroxybenzoate octaprenyltransferase [Rickettsiales bacterium]|nr:MAG: 4-hydroxybenzoate octaprenyltransferase [Rickettsiales bacterium]
MPNKTSQNKLIALFRLTRFHLPTGYLLAFFPAAFGLLLAYEETPNLNYLPLFFVGSILARSAGCVINDILDKDIDRLVARTQDRPIASGIITVTQAVIFLVLLFTGCLAILLSLSITSIALGIIAFLMILLYPIMKRITYFPQAFLGVTFNMGCLIGYAAVKDEVSYESMLLYIACGFWTFGYDTIYAFMDIKDDKKIGVWSSAIFFEDKPYKLIIAGFYVAFFVLFSIATQDSFGMYSLCTISFAVMATLWGIASLDVKDPKNCLARFKANNYLGFLLFFVMLLENL